MPLGLRNSPITFSRLMSIIMVGLEGDTVFARDTVAQDFYKTLRNGPDNQPKEVHVFPPENRLPRAYRGLRRHLTKLRQGKGHLGIPYTQ